MASSKKTGVLIVCPVYAPHAGGGGQYFPLLAQQLKSFEDIGEVAVLTERHPSRSARAVEDGIHVYRLLPQRDSLDRKTGFYSTISFAWTYILLYVWIPVLMWKHHAGVLHYTRYLRPAFYGLAWVLKSLLRKTVILDMRATVADPRCIRRLFGYSSLISNSAGVFRQMDSLGVVPERHFLVPNPVRLPSPSAEEAVRRDIAALSKDIRRPYLAFIGQLLERKSIQEVLDAFARFVQERPEHQLVLAGRNMMGAPVQRRIEEIPNVIYLGAITREQALAVMQGAELVLQPSRIEGIPRVSLEALALGKKVLLPPCVPELVEGNDKFTVTEITPDAILEAIQRILDLSCLPRYDLSVHNPESSKAVLKTVYQKNRVLNR